MSEPPRHLRLGTRGSKLALAQSQAVAAALESAHTGLIVELVIIQTTGDKVLNSPLSRIGGKGVFTKEIEEALLDGRIDIAVHSLKDLPTTQPSGLALGAITKREDPRDVLIAARPINLSGSVDGPIGTSSLRRRAQLLALHPNLTITELRGNVPTRIQRVGEGQYAAIVLAAAGVKRLGIEPPWMEYLEGDQMLPAPGQGSLGLQIREDDTATAELLRVMNHRASAAACIAERTLLQALGGGCQMPLGALGEVGVDGTLTLQGRVVSLEGDALAEGFLTGDIDDPVGLGNALADVLHARGASEILERITRRKPGDGFAEAVAVAAALDRGPLGGRTIVITRDEDADGPLALAIRQRGGQPLLIPFVENHPVENSSDLDKHVADLVAGGFDWLVYTSSRAVEAVVASATRQALVATSSRARVACVGQATAASARAAGFTVSLVPEDAQASALAAALRSSGIDGARILYPRADQAAGTLRDNLQAAGADVVDPIAYWTLSVFPFPPSVRRTLGTRRIDAVLWCSPSAVKAFSALPEDLQARLRDGVLVGSIGPRTTAALQEVGIQGAIEPEGDRSFEQMVEAITNALANLPLS